MAPEGKNHNYYDVLGLARNSSEEEIRKMYLEIMRTLHPDKSRKSGGMERFHEVQAAWRCLSDPTRRLMYDLRTFGDSSAAGKHAAGTAEMGEMLLSRQKDGGCSIMVSQARSSNILTTTVKQDEERTIKSKVKETHLFLFVLEDQRHIHLEVFLLPFYQPRRATMAP
eukprot:s2167_g3.t1